MKPMTQCPERKTLFTYYCKETDDYEVTDDEGQASVDPHHRISFYQEVKDYYLNTGEHFKNTHDTYEGLIEWVDEEDPSASGYILHHSTKEKLAQRANQ